MQAKVVVLLNELTDCTHVVVEAVVVVVVVVGSGGGIVSLPALAA